MNTNHTPGPAYSLTDPMLARATKLIEQAIVDHCQGSDLWTCAAVAAQQVIGEIAQASHHRFSGCEFDATNWKRMPPELRRAIAKATGAAA